MFVKLKTVVLNDTPKCRSGVLAQGETMGPMGLMGEGCPKCACGCPEWPIVPVAEKRVVRNMCPKCPE
ncbi:MAG: hypothetical protein WC721_02995 [Victivallaceae bacterium]